MLRSLVLRNFQGHNRSHLSGLSPGVNVVVGQSDSGKTSLIRALLWIWSNRPVGTGMIRHGRTKATAAVKLDSGERVVRIRSKGKNAYKLEDQSGKSFTFMAVNSGVPEEVEKTLNLEAVNFQRQLDSPFMLGLSPSEAAKQLNDMAGLGDIDRVLSNLATLKRRNDSAQKEAVLDRDEEMEQLTKIPNLKEAKLLLTKAEDLDRVVQEMDEQMITLNSIQEKLQEEKLQTKKLAKWLLVEDLVEGMTEQTEVLNRLKLKMEGLKDYQDRFEMQNRTGRDLQETIKKLERLWKENMPDVCPLCGRGGK